MHDESGDLMSSRPLDMCRISINKNKHKPILFLLIIGKMHIVWIIALLSVCAVEAKAFVWPRWFQTTHFFDSPEQVCMLFI